MPIKVYIWLPHGENFGHSSMTLSDGTHISWWPGNKDLKKKSNILAMISSPAKLSQSLEDDINLEGYIYPNPSHTLPGFIDEDAIRNWWESFSANGVYRVLNQNCCHVVFKALDAGGAWEIITDEDVKSRGETLLTPVDIDALVQKLLMLFQ